MGKGVRDMTEDRESIQIKGAGRTYFLDLKRTRQDKNYLAITESRKRGEEGKFGRITINVFPEDAEEFAQAVSEMISKLG